MVDYVKHIIQYIMHHSPCKLCIIFFTPVQLQLYSCTSYNVQILQRHGCRHTHAYTVHTAHIVHTCQWASCTPISFLSLSHLPPSGRRGSSGCLWGDIAPCLGRGQCFCVFSSPATHELIPTPPSLPPLTSPPLLPSATHIIIHSCHLDVYRRLVIYLCRYYIRGMQTCFLLLCLTEINIYNKLHACSTIWIYELIISL